jgi:hypothetical protein
MSKQEVRESLSQSLEQFLAAGGTITTLPAKKVRTKNTVSCRYRRGVGSKSEQFKGAEPQPLHSWCVWSPDRLNNVNYRPMYFSKKN